MVQRRCYARVWHFRILRMNQKSIKWTWAETFEMNVKIEQGSNFVIHNDSRLFFDAQETKKVIVTLVSLFEQFEGRTNQFFTDIH